LRGPSPGDFTEDGPEIEGDEEVEANRLGEDGLGSQRRLMVVAVRPLQESADTAQEQLNEVMGALAAKGLLPTNYDRANSKPLALDPADERRNPCRTRNRTVKGKIETLLERLLRVAR
jgi:hypothetical protein